MIKVGVYSLSGETLKELFFEDRITAEEWIQGKVEANFFGKPERWVREDDLKIMGEAREKAVAYQESYSGSELLKVFKFLPDYIIEIVELD